MADLNVQQRPDISDDHIIRDVSSLFDVILTKFPVTELLVGNEIGVAGQNKHEWFDDQIVQKTSILTADIAAHSGSGTALTITVADTGNFLINDQVGVETLDPVYSVTAIPDGTTLTVSVINGVALADPAGDTEVIKFNRGQLELTDFGTFQGARLGTQVENFTQIFRENVQISWHAQKVAKRQGIYDSSDLFANAVQQEMNNLAWELYQAVTTGIGVQRTTTSTIGFMKGIPSFLDVGGGNVVTASGTLTLDLLNEAAKLIYDDMNDLSQIVIVAGTQQGQKFQALDANAVRYNDPQPTRAVGANVATFIPNISGSNGIPITIDPNLRKDQIWFLDRSRMQLMSFDNDTLKLFEQSTTGTTANQGFLYGEYTLQVRNGAQAHGLIKNLTL